MMFFCKNLALIVCCLRLVVLALAQQRGVVEGESTDYSDVYLTTSAHADTVHSGPYSIINCGDKARIVSANLKNARRVAEKARASSAYGVKSPYGFKALFKSDHSRKVVADVYTDIAQGTRYPPWRSDNATQAPSLFCVNDHDPRLPANLRFNCAISEAFILATHPSVIFLCQFWWDLPAKPTACPRRVLFGSTIHFSSNGSELVSYRAGSLIHELAHLYIYPSQRLGTIWQEVYRLDECIALNQARSLKNAENYALFASGMYICRSLSARGEKFAHCSLLPLAVSFGCGEWPMG